MLEWKLIEGADQSLQVVTTLQSTPSGKRHYQGLCERQMHLRELVSGGDRDGGRAGMAWDGMVKRGQGWDGVEGDRDGMEWRGTGMEWSRGGEMGCSRVDRYGMEWSGTGMRWSRGANM